GVAEPETERTQAEQQQREHPLAASGERQQHGAEEPERREAAEPQSLLRALIGERTEGGRQQHDRQRSAGVGQAEKERRSRARQPRGPVTVKENRKQPHDHRGVEAVIGPGSQSPGPLRSASRLHPSAPSFSRLPARASRETADPASAPASMTD